MQDGSITAAPEVIGATITKAAHKQRTLRHPLARSKVTNGERLLLGKGDERTQFARRLRDIMALHIDDLSGGSGPDALSEAQLSLIRRASVLETQLEGLEVRMANGEPVNLDVYGRITGHVRRLFETLGLRRIRKDVTPTLHAIVAKHKRAEEDRADRRGGG